MFDKFSKIFLPVSWHVLLLSVYVGIAIQLVISNSFAALHNRSTRLSALCPAEQKTKSDPGCFSHPILLDFTVQYIIALLLEHVPLAV